MKRWAFFIAASLVLLSPYQAALQENKRFPAPRFPSYLKTPKNVDEVMPYARAAVRQIGGTYEYYYPQKKLGAKNAALMPNRTGGAGLREETRE